MTEFGNLALIDQDTGADEGVAIPLPGVRKGVAWCPRWAGDYRGESHGHPPPPDPACPSVWSLWRWAFSVYITSVWQDITVLG